jgi:hypothetical protein
MAGPSRSDQVTGAHHHAELTRAQSAAAASGTSSWHIPETHSTRPVAHESGGVQGGVTSQMGSSVEVAHILRQHVSADGHVGAAAAAAADGAHVHGEAVGDARALLAVVLRGDRVGVRWRRGAAGHHRQKAEGRHPARERAADIATSLRQLRR